MPTVATPKSPSAATICRSRAPGGAAPPQRVIDGVSFVLPHGRTLAVMGPTGSGKSSLAAVLAVPTNPVSASSAATPSSRASRSPARPRAPVPRLHDRIPAAIRRRAPARTFHGGGGDRRAHHEPRSAGERTRARGAGGDPARRAHAAAGRGGEVPLRAERRDAPAGRFRPRPRAAAPDLHRR